METENPRALNLFASLIHEEFLKLKETSVRSPEHTICKPRIRLQFLGFLIAA
jgi:hypothetical protein